MDFRAIRSRSKGFTCLRIRSTWTEAPPLTSTEKKPAASRYGATRTVVMGMSRFLKSDCDTSRSLLHR